MGEQFCPKFQTYSDLKRDFGKDDKICSECPCYKYSGGLTTCEKQEKKEMNEDEG